MQWFKVEITKYFITSAFNFIINIISTNLKYKYVNNHKNREAFDIQEIKRVGQDLYISTFLILILGSWCCHLFVMVKDNGLNRLQLQVNYCRGKCAKKHYKAEYAKIERKYISRKYYFKIFCFKFTEKIKKYWDI